MKSSGTRKGLYILYRRIGGADILVKSRNSTVRIRNSTDPVHFARGGRAELEVGRGVYNSGL